MSQRDFYRCKAALPDALKPDTMIVNALYSITKDITSIDYVQSPWDLIQTCNAWLQLYLEDKIALQPHQIQGQLEGAVRVYQALIDHELSESQPEEYRLMLLEQRATMEAHIERLQSLGAEA